MRNSNINNEYQGPYFILNHKNLEPGDIILERGYNLKSNVICKITNSNYSHAMIYIDGTIVEATLDGGVFSRIPNRSVVRSIEDFLVLRLSEKPSPEIMYKICNDARGLIGSQYSVKEAIQVATQKFIEASYSDSRKQFCSRLVAQIYSSNGIDLVKSPGFCSPADIENSNLVEKVPNMVIKASQEEVDFALEETPHDKHTQCAANFIKQSLSIFKERGIESIGSLDGDVTIANFNDVAMAVFQNSGDKELDEEITKAMYSSGYMDHIYSDKIENPYRYDYTVFKFEILSIADPIKIKEIIDFEFKKERDVFVSRLESYYYSKQNLNLNLKFSDAEYNIRRGLINGMLERLGVIERFTKEIQYLEVNYQCNKMIKMIMEYL